MPPIIVDSNRYKKPIPLYDSRGVKIILYIPPNFIPHSVQGQYNKKDDNFKISFYYKDEEKGTVLLEDDYICFTVGENTKKLLSVQIKGVRNRGINTITLEQKIKEDLLSDFDRAINRVSKPIEKTNLEVTKTVVSDSAPVLAGSMPNLF